MVSLVLLFLVAAAVGLYQGRIKATPLTRAVTAVVLLGVSNLLASWPWFIDDPSTWIRTYYTGLFQTGLLSLAVHVVPFFVAYYIARARSA